MRAPHGFCILLRMQATAESYSPTKLASFAPEIWSRKGFQMYEDSRVANRPAPEGAGSVPGSGTASPASSTGSPGSSSGSPGSLAASSPGSPGTGSPGSATGSLGSAGSDDKRIWCENCNTRLVELKRQALKMMVPGAFPSKVGDLARVPVYQSAQLGNRDRLPQRLLHFIDHVQRESHPLEPGH